jgi:outer membrane receptor protein involved in Fe transport
MSQVVDLLTSMSADNVERIELITTPPAQYDADGSGGIINIVEKKQNQAGTQGAYAAGIGYGWREKANGSINLTHTTTTVSTSGTYAYMHNRTQGGWHAIGTQNMPSMGGPLSVDFLNNEKNSTNNHNATLGIDIRLPKVAFGSSVAYTRSHTKRNILNLAQYAITNVDSLLLMNAAIHGSHQWQNIVSTIYVQKEITRGETLNAAMDYVHYESSNSTDVNTLFSDRAGNEVSLSNDIFSRRYRGMSKSPIRVGVVKIDYTKQLIGKLNIELGIKGTVTQSLSKSLLENFVNNEWTSNSRTTNNNVVKEHIGAVYTAWNIQINPSISLVAGLRYEYARTHLTTPNDTDKIDRRSEKLFPNFLLSKKLNEVSSLHVSYSKRIGRPSYNDLASFLAYNDPVSVFTGNPLLRPTITNTVKFGYSYNDLTLSLLASRDNFPIVRYQLTENDTRDLLYVAPQNVTFQNNITIQTTLPFRIKNWWIMNYVVSGGPRHFKLSHTKKQAEKIYVAWSFTGNQTFNLPKSYTLEFSGWYNSAQYEGSKKLDGFGMLTAGIKKELKNNKGSLQLTLSDVLKSMRVTSYFGAITEEAFELKSQVVYGAESANARIIRLTYSRSFGNAKPNGSRSAVSKDESDRIRKE